LGVETGAMQEVQCQLGLREEAIPKVNRKVFVSATEASNEMVFKGVDGTFSSIAAMHMWQDQLEIHILSYQKIFEGLRCFIVQMPKFGA